jgi:hypothetical protein
MCSSWLGDSENVLKKARLRTYETLGEHPMTAAWVYTPESWAITNHIYTDLLYMRRWLARVTGHI